MPIVRVRADYYRFVAHYDGLGAVFQTKPMYGVSAVLPHSVVIERVRNSHDIIIPILKKQ